MTPLWEEFGFKVNKLESAQFTHGLETLVIGPEVAD